MIVKAERIKYDNIRSGRVAIPTDPENYPKEVKDIVKPNERIPLNDNNKR